MPVNRVFEVAHFLEGKRIREQRLKVFRGHFRLELQFFDHVSELVRGTLSFGIPDFDLGYFSFINVPNTILIVTGPVREFLVGDPLVPLPQLRYDNADPDFEFGHVDVLRCILMIDTILGPKKVLKVLIFDSVFTFLDCELILVGTHFDDGCLSFIKDSIDPFDGSF